MRGRQLQDNKVRKVKDFPHNHKVGSLGSSITWHFFFLFLFLVFLPAWSKLIYIYSLLYLTFTYAKVHV